MKDNWYLLKLKMALLKGPSHALLAVELQHFKETTMGQANS